MKTDLPDKLTVPRAAASSTELETIELSNEYNQTTSLRKKKAIYQKVLDLIQFSVYWD